uniref:ATP-grasp domain-containing protein n=1 Tax=Fervidobacterium pennivorans TaxID=93466 RepID=A0A7V4KD79_FERPE
MKVAVVFDLDNLDPEREKMIDAVYNSLLKHPEITFVEKIPFNKDFMHTVVKFDAVFNLSTAHKQMHVPAILDLLGIPYTGSSATTHGICIDKTLTKIVLKHHGIPTPDFFVVNIGEEPQSLHLSPAIVKPSRQGSAKGIFYDSVVHDISGLRKAVNRIHEQFQEPALVEEFIEGKELSVGIVGDKVLPILEIDFSELPEGLEHFYSYRVKHFYAEQTRYYCPARISDEIAEIIKFYALKAFHALGLRNYARMDLRLKGDKVYFIEVNSLPMLTPKYSDITKMAEAAGWSYEELIFAIFNDAIRKL